MEEQWGKLYPEKLAVSTSDAEKNIARDKYLSIISWPEQTKRNKGI
jgi:hypothetical protein